MNQDKIYERFKQLSHEINLTYPQWGISQLQQVGAGLECLVCRAETQMFGPVALRMPWDRWSSNDNDVLVDGFEILAIEALIARHMSAHGIPVPEVLQLHQGENVSFLASAFIENDSSPYDLRQLGALVANIHKTTIPEGLSKTTQNPGKVAQEIANRINHRLGVLDRLAGNRPHRGARTLMSEFVIRTIMQDAPASAILHMDIRPENILTREKQIVAIIDWSNMLLADPAMEIARIAEYNGGNISSEFISGYGSNPLERASIEKQLLFRIDTAVMLAVVFLSEAPDPQRAAIQVARVDQLLEKLSSMVPAE